MSETFRAFRIHRDESGLTRAGIETLRLDDLSSGEVLIRVAYSAVNYKDALAGTGQGRILRRSPLVGGIDAAGTVVRDDTGRLTAGTPVVVTGGGLSETRDGGYAKFLRAPAEIVIPLPPDITLFEAAAMGTAGFTSALAIQRMEDNHQRPENGPVLVTGASGGVGSFAIDMLSEQGYEVHALTGKPETSGELLSELGAKEIVDRRTLDLGARPLEKALWGGAVDNVGGDVLAWLTRTLRPYGNIAAVGLAGGIELHTTVMPFILRGVSLLGIHSVDCPYELRRHLWSRLATDLRPRHLDRVVQGMVRIDGLESVFEDMLAGKRHGRLVVQVD